MILLALWPALACAQADPTSRSWNQPVEPFRIAGNLYYVGANDITSYLITTPEGHILLDSGFEETVPLIRESVKKLGFRLEDVKVLLNSHAHYDHAGGLATLKELTGAKLVASAKDAVLLARGGKGDPALGDTLLFKPVQADRIIKDGETVTLGGSTLTARLTPGHTPGCTSWTMQVDDAGKRRDVVFVCSTTILPGVTLTDNPKYPEVGSDFAHTFKVLEALPCDIFLAAHGSFFNLAEKSERLRKGAETNPFVDPAGYKAYVERKEGDYRKQLEAEKAKRVSAPAAARSAPSAAAPGL